MMIGFFPPLYPDELFYSICARFKASLLYGDRSTVMRILFGKLVAAIVDFPAHLGYLVSQFPPEWPYTADMLINKHSLFLYYQPFLPKERVQQIRWQMIDGPARGIYTQLGITQTNVRRPLFLRYCPSCAAEERTRWGECYWHRLHQLPGVLVCPYHAVFLEDSKIPTATDLREEKAFFPADDTISHSMPRNATDSPFFNTYQQLALSTAELIESALPSQEAGLWDEQYTAVMAQHGYISLGGSFRFEEFLKDFLQTYPLELLHQVGWDIGLMIANKRDWWYSLRGKARGGAVSHPLLHLLILNMFGIKITAFFRQRFTAPAAFGAGPWPCLNPAADHYRQPMITTIRTSKDSYGEKLFGRFSCSCGFIYSRTGPDERPEDRYTFSRIFAYGEILDSKLREWWADPTLKKKEIAQRIGVSLTTLKKQAIRLGLLVPPKAKQMNCPEVPSPLPKREDVERYRQEWLALLIAYPDASSGRLQRLLPRVRMWLYKHDKAWLKQHLPPPRIRTQRAKKQSVLPIKDPTILSSYRRDPDDAELATMVRTTGQQFLASSLRPKRITKDFFQKTIPALAVLRNGKDRFPLTMLAINEYTETLEQAGLRRIIWATECYLKEQVCPSRSAFEKYAGVASMKTLPSIDRAVEEALQTLEALQGHGLALAQA